MTSDLERQPRDVGELHDRPKVLGQMAHHGSELRALEEALTRVVLDQQRDFGARHELARVHGDTMS